jgi:hypothetical protein
MADVLASGAAFVLLERAVVPSARGLDALERPQQLRLIANGRDTSDPATLAMELTPHATALMPLAPVHLKARRDASGVTLSWTRRTRRGGDSWGAEVPLGEERESYEIDVMAGTSVVRTLTADGPSALYAAADEIADFGATQPSVSIAVYQTSTTIGRGIAARAILTL